MIDTILEIAFAFSAVSLTAGIAWVVVLAFKPIKEDE